MVFTLPLLHVVDPLASTATPPLQVILTVLPRTLLSRYPSSFLPGLHVLHILLPQWVPLFQGLHAAMIGALRAAMPSGLRSPN